MTTVTCAIIQKSGKILIAWRAADQKLAGKWGVLKGQVLPFEVCQEAGTDPTDDPGIPCYNMGTIIF